MDKRLLDEVIDRNAPFQIETASGRVFDVPHRDFISFTPKRTTAMVWYEEAGKERFAMIPLLTITSVMIDGEHFTDAGHLQME